MMKIRKPKPLLFFLLFLSFFLVCFMGLGILWVYFSSPVDKNDNEDIEVVIPSGATTIQIGKILKESGLIRNEEYFRFYMKFNPVSSLKADTYLLHKSMSLDEIVYSLEQGSQYHPDFVKITFKEGLRITDYAKVIEKETNHTYDEVISILNDREYLQSLISKYWFLTDEVLNSDLYYSLEGYLAPETYHFDNKDVLVQDIIETMLNQMDKNLLPYKDIISSDPHYYLTMASIVELEGTNTDNRKMIVGIFQNRLQSYMNLGSDVTTYYGLQVAMTSDLTSEEFASVNLYNTRSSTMIGKMPVGPICNPGASSIEASVYPNENDYYYFVADKNGNIYYTKTIAEHNQKVAEIKANGDWIW